MTLERPGQDLGALDAEVRPAVLDRGNRGLGDARQLRQLALAELLELAKNADGAPNDYGDQACSTGTSY